MSEIPHDLIRRIQISTRNAAGLSGYEPGNPSLPVLPSFSATISSLEPSSPNLRCRHCKGRLLRGLDSFICVYCGNPHQNDIPPDPICFNSTTGYQWLLQFLQLDGSEMIEPLTEKSEPNRAQGSSKAEISLSDSLNFRITWQAELQKQDANFSERQLEESGRSLNLTGVNLDNFFPDSNSDVSERSVEQPGTSNQVKTSRVEFTASDDLDLFQNFQPSEPAISSLEGKNEDAFSGRETGFQPTASGKEFGGSATSDLFMSSSLESGKKFQDAKSSNPLGVDVDLSAHMESLFGSGTGVNDKKLKENSANSPPFGDWNSNDFLSNVSLDESQLAAGLDATFRVKDDNLLQNSNHSSTDLDRFQDNQWKTNKADEPQNSTVSRDEDLFDEWDDFTGSASKTDETQNSTVSRDNDSVNEWNDFTGSASTHDPPKNASTQSDYQLSASFEKPSEIDLLSLNSKVQEMEFDSFAQPDLFSGSSSDNKFSTKVNTILQEVPGSDRSVETSGLSEDAAKNGEVFSKSLEPNDDVTMLISQMHDLAFMLKTDLSIPSKSDSQNSSQPD